MTKIIGLNSDGKLVAVEVDDKAVAAAADRAKNRKKKRSNAATSPSG